LTWRNSYGIINNEGGCAMISYDPLWHLLVDRKMGKLEMCRAAGIATSTLAKLGKNEYVSLRVIENICKALDCRIEQIIEIKKDPS
jgi:putative transcriptional regulator